MGALAAQNASLLAQVEQLQAQMGAQAAASQEASQLQVCVSPAAVVFWVSLMSVI
jgi:hypothetical protein